jgi:hypothetical protein
MVSLAEGIQRGFGLRLNSTKGEQKIFAPLPDGPAWDTNQSKYLTIPTVQSAAGVRNRSLSGRHGDAILRGDLRGYKATMYRVGGTGLCGMMSASYFMQSRLTALTVRTISEINAEFGVRGSLYLLHNLGDDVIVHGTSEEIVELATRLELNCADIADGLSCAVAHISAGSASKDISQDASRVSASRRSTRY